MGTSIEDSLVSFPDNKSQKGKIIRRIGGFLWRGVTSSWDKSITSRRFDVSAQEYAIVLNSTYELFKGDAALSEALGWMEVGLSPVEVYDKHRELFARGAKVLGPRSIKYYKFPFKHPIRVETDEITIDPEPTEETADFFGCPITFLVDTKINYVKHPFLFPIKNAGKLINGGPSWKQRVEEEIISNVGEIIHDHFRMYSCKFPEVCVNEIEPLRTHSKNRSLIEKYGITAEIKIKKFRLQPNQERAISQAMEFNLTSSRTGRLDLNSFIEAVNKIDELCRTKRLDPNFRDLFSNFIHYQRSVISSNFFPQSSPQMEIQSDAYVRAD